MPPEKRPSPIHGHGHGSLPEIDLARDALLLDVDGTLIDIAPTPDAVHVPERLSHTLARLEELSGGGVALISGRTLASLDALFSPLSLPAAGSHGAEIRPQTGGREFYGPRLPDFVRESFAGLDEKIAGLRVEDKGYTLAFHYRSIREREDEILAAMHARMETLSPDFELLHGKAIVEVKPKGFNKGTALHALMKQAPFAGRRPVFHGDDVTDEDVFAALHQYGGVGIAVGRHFEGAQFQVDTPSDIRRWLQDLAGIVDETGPDEPGGEEPGAEEPTG
jgi:trehalose 6-phosphate phosphatase